MKKIILLMPILLIMSCSSGKDDVLISNLYAKISMLQYELNLEQEKLSILTCESGIKHEGVWGDNGKSYGVAQWQLRTFNEMKTKAGLPHLNWKSQKDQIHLLDFALRNGYGKYWSCYSGNK